MSLLNVIYTDIFLTIMFYNFILNDRPLNYIYKPYICKMRISAHNLNIETGRFYNLDRHERVCSMCNLKLLKMNTILFCNVKNILM